jgi:hypothetical protein
MTQYQITAFSAWQKPQTFIVDTESEKDELILALKDQQYKVEWEEILP